MQYKWESTNGNDDTFTDGVFDADNIDQAKSFANDNLMKYRPGLVKVNWDGLAPGVPYEHFAFKKHQKHGFFLESV